MERDKERGTRRGKDKDMAVIHSFHCSGLVEERRVNFTGVSRVFLHLVAKRVGQEKVF